MKTENERKTRSTQQQQQQQQKDIIIISQYYYHGKYKQFLEYGFVACVKYFSFCKTHI